MKAITHRPLFWILFSAVSLACSYGSYHYFSTAFPIVNLSLAMNRVQALEKASELAQHLHIGTDEYEQAASFDLDNEVQTFVELEAGGSQAFIQMIQEPYYAPYQWTVRHFKEHETHECTIRFKPDGTPYGFKETLSETVVGAALSAQEAQAVAQQTVSSAPWNIAIADYSLIESSKETKPSSRIDHTFIYERSNVRIGQGFYRLRIVVSGDHVSEITHFVKIPEAFTLTYQEMRSANNSIAAGAQMAYLIFYILGGCFIGLFMLLRRNWILWKQGLLWAFIIAALHLLTSLNQLPLAWMQYHTALSMHGFLLKYCMAILYQFFSMTAFYGLVFVAAESLTRAAFGTHPQFWRVWDFAATHSSAIAGRTIGGYLMVPIYIAFIIAFYIGASHSLGWWTPAASLSDPNVLATYFPWLSCLVLSLGAGFMEECLFRAIPISCSVLLGNRFGNKKLWIVLGFIVQALIFGAAHANYAAQPAYARVVELLFFSIVNGLIYFKFGLLPAIIAHFSYDVVLMALPLFASTAHGACLHQLIVILIALIPLFIVLRSRIVFGSWSALPDTMLNSAWMPAKFAAVKEEVVSTQESVTFSTCMQKSIAAAGLLGIALWFSCTHFKQDAPALPITKTQALKEAHQFFEKQNEAHTQFDALPMVAGKDDDTQALQHRFIWQEELSRYHELIGRYLNPPRWYIRFVRWQGTPSERAEEYGFSFIEQGKPYRIYHALPETAPGKTLSEQEARIIAQQAVKERFDLDPAAMKEISAEATHHPHRRDWTFIFASIKSQLTVGQLRNEVHIAGDQVTANYGYIHIPEAWEREKHDQDTMLEIIAFLCMLFMYLALSAGIFFAYMRTQKVMLMTRTTFFFCAGLCALGIAKLVNNWPAIIALFTPSEPFSHQLFSVFGASLIGIIFKAGAFGILLAALTHWKKPYALLHNHHWLYGICIGAACSAIFSLINALQSSYAPLWADYTPFGTLIPSLGIVLQATSAAILLSGFIMLLCTILDSLHAYWHNHVWRLCIGALFFGIGIAGRLEAETITLWLIDGIIIGALLLMVYIIIGRYSNKALLWAGATITGLYYLQQALFNAYPGALLGNLLAIGAVIGVACLWDRYLK